MGVRYPLGRPFLEIWRRFRRRIGKRSRRRKIIMHIRIILIRAIIKNQRKEKRRNQRSFIATMPLNNSSMLIKITTPIPQKTRSGKCARTLKHKNNQKSDKKTNQPQQVLTCSIKRSFKIKAGVRISIRKGHLTIR